MESAKNAAKPSREWIWDKGTCQRPSFTVDIHSLWRSCTPRALVGQLRIYSDNTQALKIQGNAASGKPQRSDGAWRSLVARLLWEQDAGSSNLFAPTRKEQADQALGLVCFFFGQLHLYLFIQPPPLRRILSCNNLPDPANAQSP